MELHSPQSSTSSSKGQRTSEITEWGLWPRQALAFFSPANEQLFGGASEGGKSYFGRYALAVWCSAIPHLQCYIFRKFYGDVISNHMTGVSSFHSILRQWVNDKLVKITENEVQFWNGSLISLHGILHDKDLEKHVGREKQVLWLDEAGQIPKRHIDALRAWTRMPLDMKAKLPEQLKSLYPNMSPEQRMELFPRVLYTTNPEGPSLGHFRRGFVVPREPFEIERAADKDGGFLRQFIPSRIEDNPAADPVAQRRRLLPLGEARAKALIEGDWSAPTGDFFKEYDDDLHAVPDFVPPSHLFKFRTFDWGSAEPFCVYWWCVWDSEAHVCPTLEDGKWVSKERWFPRGSLVAYREWYGCNPDEPAEGVHMRNEDIAKGIVSRTKETISGLTFSDRYPFADRGESRNGRKYTMADDFFENGCPLTLGNCARVFGWKQMRSRLQGVGGVPLLYFVQSCVYARDYVPAIGYHETKEEDAQEDGEATHSPDSIRLACAIRPLVQDKPEEAPAHSHMLTPKKILESRKATTKPSFGRR
jgi:hypothetical protein